MKKLYFIYNPNAGKGLIKRELSTIIEIFSRAGYEITLAPTACAGDAKNLVYKALGSGFFGRLAYTPSPVIFESSDLSPEKIPETNRITDRIIVCSGGDGTLNETICGIMSTPVFEKPRVPLGYIPAGTANDFARSLGIPTDMVSAANLIVNGRVFPCDIGSFNDSYFTYIAAFGAFTAASYETSQNLKNTIGYAAYLFEVIKESTSLRSYYMHIEHDEGFINGEFAYGMVTNALSVGKFLKQKDVVLDDGIFEVTLIRMPSNILDLGQIAGSLMNLNGEIDNEHVTCFRTAKLIVKSAVPVDWTVDGEYGGTFRETIITNRQKSLNLIISCEESQKNLDEKKNM